jgi:CDP-paratose 2-epimerase
VTRTNLITGGAGFIGSNLAQRLLSMGERVLLLDNLSRPNVSWNAAWLRNCFDSRAELHVADILDESAVRECVSQAEFVFHFAAQVAVTSSLTDPLHDFDVNARGTLNVLEAVRSSPRRPAVFFTSTNKVYGELGGLGLSLGEHGYQPIAADIRQHGVREDAPLDFHSPYGCSKGCADQYVRDYARCFGVPAVVFRMSCIYGPRQFGTEDQGWVAHFLLRALRGEPITVYGDGHQTRDLLYVGDLVEAFLTARARLDVCSGQAFNIGGGPKNCASVLVVLQRAGALTRSDLALSFDAWRTGDQRYYVSDVRKFSRLTGWQPRVSLPSGLVQLGDWLRSVVEAQQGSDQEPARQDWQPLANAALGSHSAGNGAAQ